MTDKNTLDLARVFAESVESRPSAYDEQVRAAADLISSLPDEWVDAEKLREVVADHHIDMSEELMEALGDLLPAPPAPSRTMAEIEWDDAEHHLAEALFGDTRKVVMLARDTDEEGDWYEWINCRMEDGSIDLIEKAYLTPTGRKYRLEPENDTRIEAQQ